MWQLYFTVLEAVTAGRK